MIKAVRILLLSKSIDNTIKFVSRVKNRMISGDVNPEYVSMVQDIIARLYDHRGDAFDLEDQISEVKRDE